MIYVTTLAVGRPGPLAPAIAEYEARAARYWRFEAIEVARARGPRARGRAAGGSCGRAAVDAMRREAAAVRARLRPGFVRVALTRGGRSINSVDLSRWLQRLATGPERGVHFIIGGAFGIDPGLLRECEASLSLSSLTMPHDLARLVLAEQLYRAGTIARREPYHKGGG